MSDASASVLARRLGRKIARRQRFARWGKAVALPALLMGLYSGRWSGWFVGVGFVVFLFATFAVLTGESLRCPRCEAQLVSGRGWDEEFTGTCPEWVSDRLTSASPVPNERSRSAMGSIPKATYFSFVS